MSSGHQHERWTSRLARAPADQVRGRRGGPRAPLACLAVLAVLGTLASRDASETGVWGDGPTTVDYVLDGPDWTGPASAVSVAVMVLAALLLWAARGRLLLAAGLVLLPLGLVAAFASQVEHFNAGRVAAADVKRVPLGSTREELLDRLGAPAGHATRTHRGDQLDCLMYLNERGRGGRGPDRYALCLREGRLVVKDSV